MPHKQTQSGGQKHSSRKIAALYWNKFGASQGYRFMRRHSIICESSGLLIKMSTSNLTLCTPPFIQSTFTFLLLHLKCAQGREKQIKKAQPLAMSCSSSGGRGPQRSRQWRMLCSVLSMAGIPEGQVSIRLSVAMVRHST